MPDMYPTILESARMRFRRFVPDDLDALYALYADKETRQYIPDSIDGTLTYAETKEELEWFQYGHPKHPELGLWATILKETGAFIGRCGLLPWTLEGRAEVEIAYLIDKRYWRQGLGTEAARAIRDYAFTQLGLSRLVSLIEPGNIASAKVAANIGMTLEKEMVDEKGPFLLYTLEKRPGGAKSTAIGVEGR
jgi:ribosomal-protein-alanine N-acetyltransferase